MTRERRNEMKWPSKVENCMVCPIKTHEWGGVLGCAAGEGIIITIKNPNWNVGRSAILSNKPQKDSYNYMCQPKAKPHLFSEFFWYVFVFFYTLSESFLIRDWFNFFMPKVFCCFRPIKSWHMKKIFPFHCVKNRNNKKCYPRFIRVTLLPNVLP